MSENTEKKRKIKNWLKKPSNLILIAILLASLILRIYFFSISAGQTLWWDESEYMSTAKHWAFGVPFDLNYQRPPLFQLLGALLLKIGFSDVSLIFLLDVIPSTILVFIVFLLGKEMFSERVGLFAAAATSLIWSYLFWSVRFQPDFFSISFQLLAVLFYWKLCVNPKVKYAVFVGFFASIAFYFKISALLIPMSIFVFAFAREGFSFIKNKMNWIAAGAYVLTYIPFMVWQYITFGNPLAFAPSYASTGARAGRELGWQALSYVYSFPKAIFFSLFLIGILLFLFKFLLSLDIYVKEKNRSPNADLFSFIIILFTLCFYVFFTKGTIEDRWVFIMAPFIMLFAAKGGFYISDLLKKIDKKVAILFILVIFAIFAYTQFEHSKGLIDNKKTSYSPVRDAGLYIKTNSESGALVTSISFTQMTAYSEREVRTYSTMSEAEFSEWVKNEKPEFFMVSIFEPHPSWAFQQLATADGGRAWVIPYLNSSMLISSQGQLASYDIKPQVIRDGVTYTLVYPQNEVNGVFLYRLSY